MSLDWACHALRKLHTAVTRKGDANRETRLGRPQVTSSRGTDALPVTLALMLMLFNVYFETCVMADG
jgi:hypothetical protein